MANSGAPAKRRRARLEKGYWGYIFIAPFFIAYIIFSAYPLISTFFYSVTDKNTFGSDYEIIGFDNFYKKSEGERTVAKPVEGNDAQVSVGGRKRDILINDEGQEYYLSGDGKEVMIEREADGTIWAVSQSTSGLFATTNYRNMFFNTPLLWLIGFIPQIGLALLLAAWFTDLKVKVKGQGFFKVLFYLPNIMTAATIGAMFLAFTNPTGIIHNIAIWLGVIQSNEIITSPVYTRGLVGFINFWMWYGNSMIVLIAGILGINPSLFEAANIDGANGNQVFWQITVPLIRPILTFTLVQSLIGGFQMYDVPKTLSGFASTLPGTSLSTVMTNIQQIAFGSSEMIGLASAVSVVLFAITTVLSIIIFALMKDRSEAKYLRQQKKLAKMKLGGAVNG